MTPETKVFCKDCMWYKCITTGTRILADGYPDPTLHEEYCGVSTLTDSITGKPAGRMKCHDKNANCDCADYEAKEVTP